MALDFFNNEIKIGDTVAFMQKSYRSLKIGTVISITTQTVLIEHERFNVGGTTTRQQHSQVIIKK